MCVCRGKTAWDRVHLAWSMSLGGSETGVVARSDSKAFVCWWRDKHDGEDGEEEEEEEEEEERREGREMRRAERLALI